MTVQELFCSLNPNDIAEASLLYCPPWEEYENYNIEQKLYVTRIVKEKAKQLLERINILNC